MNHTVARALAACLTLILASVTGAQLPANAAVKATTGASIVSSVGTVSSVGAFSSAGVGATVRVKPATWPLAVSKRSFSWYLNGKTITGKTSSSLRLVAAYLAKRITVRETATFRNKSKATSTSGPLRVGVISLAGDATLGYPIDDKTKLHVTLPQINTANALVSYAWQRGPSDIAGATGPDYTLGESDYGMTITASVTVKVKGYSTEELFTNAVTVVDPAVDGPGVKTLVWRQDFNESAGTQADSSIWTPDIGDGTSVGNVGWGNQERQYYTADSVATDGSGSLVLSASRDASQYNCYYGTCEWKSGKITTKGKLGFKFGRIEARIKNATGKGTWPAFWMLGANYREAPGQSADWPFCGEIDIMETTGDNPMTNFGTPHSPDFHTGGQYQFTEPSANDYHTYAIEWTKNHIAWFVDDVKYYEVSAAMYGNNYYPFNNEFYLLLDLAMGGAWPGNVASNVQSAKLSVDWIRFYTIDGVGTLIAH